MKAPSFAGIIQLTCALFVRSLALGQEGTTCPVEQITDGDTIRCGGERVRLLLIDAPEENQGAFGRAAQAFLEAIIPPNSEVSLVYDVEHRDQYNRLLAYVYRFDGRMVNLVMVRQGFAVPLVVPPNVRHVEVIRVAADSAREAGIGLWAVGAFECRPDSLRKGLCDATTSVSQALGDGFATSGVPGTCDPSYPDVCIPSPPPDLDCSDILHRRFRVVGSDPHRFDGGGDGIGCEAE